ncbi:hypothetical protein JTE90_012366 [Oedothorax gibbosus]|uniref:Uncharacterized protein n=1 Tax=Oedothorax gibbosus TaxID=931172 RepID=A0AAV6UQD0_9ARAC|nr:hypothetical protein JTE90_012366 [Oedothorax gibbosus]
MGAVICGSRNATSTDRGSGKQSSKFLRRKNPPDSTCDSSNLVECSSPTKSTGKETHSNKCDDQYCISQQIETKERKFECCTIENSSSLLCQKKECSSSQLFRQVWRERRKHKTYSSESLQSLRKITPTPTVVETGYSTFDNFSENANKPIYAESIAQTNVVSVEDRCTSTITFSENNVVSVEDRCTSTIACAETNVVSVEDRSTSTIECVDSLAKVLSSSETCGLCDFLKSGSHSRWDGLETDATVFKEITRDIHELLNTTCKNMTKIKLQKMEPRQNTRIVIKRDRDGLKEIIISNGGSAYQIQVKFETASASSVDEIRKRLKQCHPPMPVFMAFEALVDDVG